MSQPLPHPLARLRGHLETLAATGDVAGLAACLEGAELPALGGNQGAADLIFQALGLQPYDASLASRLAALLGEVAQRWGEGAPVHPLTAAELFLLAANLPADAALFEGLMGLSDFAERHPELERTFTAALACQQVDDRLEGEWLRRIAANGGGPEPLDDARADRLLAAWNGLLWIPPSRERQVAGEVVEIERVERGLLALQRAVRRSPDGEELLRVALAQLEATYPRSGEFWHQRFALRAFFWPAALQQVMREQWPGMDIGRKAGIKVIGIHTRLFSLEPKDNRWNLLKRLGIRTNDVKDLHVYTVDVTSVGITIHATSGILRVGSREVEALSSGPKHAKEGASPSSLVGATTDTDVGKRPPRR